MIKALVQDPGARGVLMLGLSFENLKRFREQPLDTFIRVDGSQFGLPHDIIIFSGETEVAMEKMLAGDLVK